MRPLGTTPPPPPPPPSSSSSAVYPQMFPSNNISMTNDSHHYQYGAFSPNLTAVACSSSGYPSFFPSKFSSKFLLSSSQNKYFLPASARGYDGLNPFSTPYNRSCPPYSTGIQPNLSSGK